MSDDTTNENVEHTPVKGKRGFLGRLVKFMFFAALLAAVLAAATAYGLYMHFSRDLPKINSLKDYNPPTITRVYSDDGREIAEFFKERRIVVPLDQMPDMLKQAFIAAEDARFYEHEGIDLLGILRAAVKNIEAGAIVQGGSTITQQVTRSFLLSSERSYTRKAREAILAYRIEKAFTKDEILFLYLNQIYLGNGAYGVEAAAQNYFAKSCQKLTLAECAMLAGLPQAPSAYSPLHNPKKARDRQVYVLTRMVDTGVITSARAAEAMDRKIELKTRRNTYFKQAPQYTEYVRRYVEDKYGKDALYTQGLSVYTAVNIESQKQALKALETGLRDLDKRQGYRGPLKHLPKEEIEAAALELAEEPGSRPLAAGEIVRAVVVEVDDREKLARVRMGKAPGILRLKDMSWASKPDPEKAYYQRKLSRPGQALSMGDLILVRLLEPVGEDKGAGDRKTWYVALEQEPAAQSALVCIETETGHVKAMIGGMDFRKSQFNRAIQARRQPGSAFKPIIYAAALDKGYTAASVLYDTPITYWDDEMDFVWKPRNYKKTFQGKTLLRQALEKSKNVVTIKILQDLGVDYVIDYARKLGIEAEFARDLSIALGSSGMPLLEVVAAYSVFANQGNLIEPCFVTRIEDRRGNVLEESTPQPARVIEKSTAYIMTHLLQGVVQNGTGWRIKALDRPVAGKTGTTNDLQDAWFVGYTPRYVTGTWVGFDDGRPLGKGETGSRAASPIWLDFMQRMLEDEPVRSFTVPEEVMFARIDARTGLLAVPESEETIFECFKEGTAPEEYTPRPDSVDKGGLLKGDI
ncbi:MAG: penicillin-binding protein 1A [Desulfatibacillaceae bacterium]